ncbi:MAG: phosphoribosylglycinamide formyltransferase [Bacteroidales bacterium]|nr:phosphoribosylglycinamide formyltransferase [Bacteroidales bacterium]HPY82377.1 phosphoribosylglycinamide formyltransferase [Bacteroidales bacterium]
MARIAIFASGSGTNAITIIKNFLNSKNTIVSLYCNNPSAQVVQKAPLYSVPVVLFSHSDLYDSDVVHAKLCTDKIDVIVLAGFLWLLPPPIIASFSGRIINIHPSLLPKYGGKGMYGMNVHNAVIQNREKESGITIHMVDEKYDNGSILFQAKCQITPFDTARSLSKKVQALEHEHYSPVIAHFLDTLQ